MSLSWLKESLQELSRRGLLRDPRCLQSPTGPEVTIDDRRVLLFCSNDYLGLATHPDITSAAHDAIEHYGVGAPSSRLISGTHTLHRQLEERLAQWLEVERALLFPAGFMANLAVLSTLPGPSDLVFSDELNHASIIRGCQLSQAPVTVYPHNDVDALEGLITRRLMDSGVRRRFIVTDSVFSVDGDEADLAGLAELAKRHDAALIVDEAHALGVLGPAGRGLCSFVGVIPDVVVGTFGKAFGCSGAFVAGSAELIRYLESRAAPFMYTTATPPALAAAATASLSLVEKADAARAHLLDLAHELRAAIEATGIAVHPNRNHIVPAIVPGVEQVVSVSSELFRRGVFVQALRPPTVPPGTERLRWTPTSKHTSEQIQHAAATFAEVLDDLDVVHRGAR